MGWRAVADRRGLRRGVNASALLSQNANYQVLWAKRSGAGPFAEGERRRALSPENAAGGGPHGAGYGQFALIVLAGWRTDGGAGRIPGAAIAARPGSTKADPRAILRWTATHSGRLRSHQAMRLLQGCTAGMAPPGGRPSPLSR